MKSTVGIFLILLLVSIFVRNSDQSCIAYDGTLGYCDFLNNCNLFLNLLTRARYGIGNLSHQQIINIIIKSTCGYIRNDPLVCCPEYQPYPFVDSFVTPPFSDSNTNEPAFDNQLDDENVKLPEDCGKMLTYKVFSDGRTNLDDFPWVALLEFDTAKGKQLGCGGALINNRYVLTAAHCVVDFSENMKLASVRLGEYDTSTEIDCLSEGDGTSYCSDQYVSIPIEERIVHPNFVFRNNVHRDDIALLRLAEEVVFTYYIQPICLPLKESESQRFIISGWGKSYLRQGTNFKQVSHVSLLDRRDCANKYRSNNFYINAQQICAGWKPNEKPCVGDLGGSLMGYEEKPNKEKRVTAYGILTFTRPMLGTCESNGWPGIYTKVVDYVPWILNQIKN